MVVDDEWACLLAFKKILKHWSDKRNETKKLWSLLWKENCWKLEWISMTDRLIKVVWSWSTLKSWTRTVKLSEDFSIMPLIKTWSRLQIFNEKRTNSKSKSHQRNKHKSLKKSMQFNRETEFFKKSDEWRKEGNLQMKIQTKDPSNTFKWMNG